MCQRVSPGVCMVRGIFRDCLCSGNTHTCPSSTRPTGNRNGRHTPDRYMRNRASPGECDLQRGFDVDKFLGDDEALLYSVITLARNCTKQLPGQQWIAPQERSVGLLRTKECARQQTDLREGERLHARATVRERQRDF